VLDDRGGVGDDAGDEDLALGQLDVLPHAPLVRVAGRRRLHGIGLGLDHQQEVHDVPETEIVDVRPLPAAPAEVRIRPVLVFIFAPRSIGYRPRWK